MDQLPLAISQALATLAANTGIRVVQGTQTQNYKAMSLKCVASVIGLTVGDGPFLWGLASGELTLAEIEEYLEGVPTSRRDVPAVEQVKRAVQVLGGLGPERLTEWKTEQIILPTWREGIGFSIWIYNQGPSMTTGATFKLRGRTFGRWLD